MTMTLCDNYDVSDDNGADGIGHDVLFLVSKIPAMNDLVNWMLLLS